MRAVVRSVARNLAGAFGCVVFGVSLYAQPIVRVASEVECVRCTVSLAKLATVGGAQLEEPILHVDVAVRTRSGMIVVGSVNDQRLMLFDANGRFMRSVGRMGSGPGEYQGIVGIALGIGDTVHVFDESNARRTILTPDLRVVRQSRIPPSIVRDQAIVLGRDELLVNAQIRSGERAGLPLHLINGDGDIVRSFGSVEPMRITRTNLRADLRTLAPSTEGSVWSIDRVNYIVELWGLDGVVRSRFKRDAEWLQPPPQNTGMDGGPRAPTPTVRAAWEDSHSQLWVFSLVADASWRSGLLPIVQEGRIASYRVGDPSRLYDTVVEVIDLKTKKLIMSHRINAFVSRVSADGVAMTARQDEDGFEFLEFFRVGLQDPRRSR